MPLTTSQNGQAVRLSMILLTFVGLSLASNGFSQAQNRLAPATQTPPSLQPATQATEPPPKAAEKNSPSVFYLKYSNAQSVADQLNAIFASGATQYSGMGGFGGGENGGKVIRIFPDPRLNLLMVYAPSNTVAEIAEVLKHLDRPVEKLPTQASQESELGSDKNNRKVVMYWLRNADANAVLEILQTVYADSPNLRLSSDRVANKIIAYGTEAILQSIESTIETLDSTKNTTPRVASTGVIRLKEKFRTENGSMFVSQLAQMHQLESAIDGSLGMVYVKGLEEDIKKFQDRIREMERVSLPLVESGPIAARVLWLISNNETESTLAKPGNELSPVLARLDSLGIKDLRIAAQFISPLNIDANEEHGSKIEGFTLVDNSPIRLSAEFTHIRKDSGFGIFTRLRIAVQSLDGKTGKPLDGGNPTVELESVRLVSGKTVIIGTAPWFDRQSVFLVQLLDNE